jgi:hypothetical protein
VDLWYIETPKELRVKNEQEVNHLTYGYHLVLLAIS